MEPHVVLNAEYRKDMAELSQKYGQIVNFCVVLIAPTGKRPPPIMWEPDELLIWGQSSLQIAVYEQLDHSHASHQILSQL